MRVAYERKRERTELAKGLAPDERLARPIEVECPVCGSMEGESCIPLTGAGLVGRYHEDRRWEANRTPLDRGGAA